METNQNQPPLAPPSAQPALLEQIEQFFKTYLHDKAPFHFPPSVKEFFVKFGPWFTLIAVLISIPALLVALGLTAIVMPFAMQDVARSGGFGIIGVIFSLASLALEGFALPGLFARKIQGWRFAYYAALVSTLGSLLSGEIISAVIGIVISMYVLLEIKEYYK
ncbi:MAG: chromate transporter [Candidatus Doudnabacteria bacterium]|jgi:hypothetical protein